MIFYPDCNCFVSSEHQSCIPTWVMEVRSVIPNPSLRIYFRSHAYCFSSLRWRPSVGVLILWANRNLEYNNVARLIKIWIFFPDQHWICADLEKKWAKSVQLVRVSFFRSDFLQNPYFSTLIQIFSNKERQLMDALMDRTRNNCF